MKRTGPPRRKKAMGRSALKRVRPHEWPASVVAEVNRRSGGHCEARITGDCTGWARHLHHRKLAKQGGPDTAANALHVCAECHHAIHNGFHTYALATGMLLHAHVRNDDIEPYNPWRRSDY